MTALVIRKVVTALATLCAVAFIIPQCRRPRWWLGRMIARMMNLSHAALTAWGLKHVPIESSDTILDVGCGGGRTIRTLAEASPDGKVFGVDYSRASVAVSKKTNADLIAANRVDIREASVSRLPFPDSAFDLVTAIETHYYWPDPVSDFREVLRVLKPGGRFVIIAEAHAARTIGQHTEQLKSAGYVATATHAEPGKGWLCVVTTKPGTAAPAA